MVIAIMRLSGFCCHQALDQVRSIAKFAYLKGPTPRTRRMGKVFAQRGRVNKNFKNQDSSSSAKGGRFAKGEDFRSARRAKDFSTSKRQQDTSQGMPPWKGQAPGRGSIGYQSNESARGRWQNEPATADPLSDDTLPSGGPERLASGQDDRFNTARRQPANRSFRGEDSSQSQDNRFNGNIQRRGPPKVGVSDAAPVGSETRQSGTFGNPSQLRGRPGQDESQSPAGHLPSPIQRKAPYAGQGGRAGGGGARFGGLATENDSSRPSFREPAGRQRQFNSQRGARNRREDPADRSTSQEDSFRAVSDPGRARFNSRRWDGQEENVNPEYQNFDVRPHGGASDVFRQGRPQNWDERGRPFRETRDQQPQYGRPPPIIFDQRAAPMHGRFAPAEESRLKEIREGWTGDALYGVFPVLNALSAKRRRVYSLYVQKGLRAKDNQIAPILKLAEESNIKAEFVSKHDINELTSNAAHQGVLLDCSALLPYPMEAFPAAASQGPETFARPPLWLALDEVQDPHNFGAILRSALFLGVTGVVTCTRNSSPLSAVVSKSSAGALEHMVIRNADKLQQTLAQARKDGWNVLGATAQTGSQDCSTINLKGPTILVIGSEGKGLRSTVSKACTAHVQIEGKLSPLGGSNDQVAVDSLNVSVAAGILTQQLLSRASWDTSAHISTAVLPSPAI